MCWLLVTGNWDCASTPARNRIPISLVLFPRMSVNLAALGIDADPIVG